MKVVHWLLARLKEPSTWAGFAALAMSFGLTQEGYEAISGAGIAIAGAVAVFLREKSDNTSE